MLGTRGQHMVTRGPYAWIGICVFTPTHSQCYTLDSKETVTVRTRAFTSVGGTVHIPLVLNEYHTAYAWHKGPVHGDTSTLCMDRSMLYPWLQGDVDCTYESIHTCRRYSTHPLGVNEYDTAYAASGTMPSTERTQTNTLSKGGCLCYRPA